MLLLAVASCCLEAWWRPNTWNMLDFWMQLKVFLNIFFLVLITISCLDCLHHHLRWNIVLLRAVYNISLHLACKRILYWCSNVAIYYVNRAAVSQTWLPGQYPFSIMKEVHAAHIPLLLPGTQQRTSAASPPPSSISRPQVHQQDSLILTVNSKSVCLCWLHLMCESYGRHLERADVALHERFGAVWKKTNKLISKPSGLVAGWYWGSISASEAREALLKRSEGTFLMRDSSHPQYMLALSVKTRSGPTSIRIEYSKGSFWLDSISPGLPHLQSFPDVLSLIQHYMGSGHTPQGQASSDIHPKTKPNPAKLTAKDSSVPLKLMQPLHKPEAFPSLQHLARLTINRHTSCPEQLPLPKPLLRYLQDYPFHIWGSPWLWCRTQGQGHTPWTHTANLGQRDAPGHRWAQQENTEILRCTSLLENELSLTTELLLFSRITFFVFFLIIVIIFVCVCLSRGEAVFISMMSAWVFLPSSAPFQTSKTVICMSEPSGPTTQPKH